MKVKMSKNIQSYKPKFIGNFTARQTVSLVVTLIIVAPLYYFSSKVLGDDISGWLAIIVAMPILAFGWIEFQGLPFEKFIKELIISEVIAPKVRPFVYEYEMDEFIKKEEELEYELLEKEQSRKRKNRKKGKEK